MKQLSHKMRNLELLRNQAFVSLVDGKKITSLQIKWIYLIYCLF